MKRYLLSWLILTFFAITGCKAPKQEVLSEITFWAVDQSGNAVQNAKITYGEETLTTDESGKVLIKLNVGMALNARIKAEKENYVFLGPEKVTSLNPDLRAVVLTLFSNYTFTASAYLDDNPYPNVTVRVDNKECKTGDNGEIEKQTFPGERSNPIIVSVDKVASAELIGRNKLSFDLDKYELSHKFEFKKVEEDDDEVNDDDDLIDERRLSATLVIYADHGANFTVEGHNETPLTRHDIKIHPGQQPITVRSPDKGVRIQITFAGINIQNGRKYRCRVNFLTRLSSPVTPE